MSDRAEDPRFPARPAEGRRTPKSGPGERRGQREPESPDPRTGTISSSREFSRWTDRANMACPFHEQERGRRIIAITPFYGAAGYKETAPCSENRFSHEPSVELGVTAHHANCVPSASSPDPFIGDKDASPGRQIRLEDPVSNPFERARSSFDTMTGRKTGGSPWGSITIHFGISAELGGISPRIDRASRAPIDSAHPRPGGSAEPDLYEAQKSRESVHELDHVIET